MNLINYGALLTTHNSQQWLHSMLKKHIYKNQLDCVIAIVIQIHGFPKKLKKSTDKKTNPSGKKG